MTKRPSQSYHFLIFFLVSNSFNFLFISFRWFPFELKSKKAFVFDVGYFILRLKLWDANIFGIIFVKREFMTRILHYIILNRLLFEIKSQDVETKFFALMTNLLTDNVIWSILTQRFFFAANFPFSYNIDVIFVHYCVYVVIINLFNVQWKSCSVK